MKKIIFFTCFILLYVSAYAQLRNAEFQAIGTYKTVERSGSTTLEEVYIFKTLTGAKITYTTNVGNSVKAYTYETSINGERNDITLPLPVPAGQGREMYTITNLEDARGLAFEDNNRTKAVWIIDYNTHRPQLHSITPVESADKCEALKLEINKDDFLFFRETTGQQKEIKRKYEIEYDIQTWDGEEFVTERKVLKDLIIGTEIVLVEGDLPNLKTEFALIGDQFSKAFGSPEKVISSTYEPASAIAKMTHKQHNRESDNEIGANGTGLGGSAPVEIDFFGHANEPAADHYSWFIYNKKDMKNPEARYNDKDMNYIFQNAGDYIVTLEVANINSGCTDTVSVNLNISESDLQVPNFFSPGSTPGQNDIFKVSYKSIVKFKCTIFNRWGNKVYEWTDPSQGWDGRHNGKLVNPGVYYYVIDATGSEGKRYKKGGDINILR